MIRLFVTLMLFVLTSPAFSQTFEAKSIDSLLQKISQAEFEYDGRGKLFGSLTIESCLYHSDDFIILKNYCWPVKTYPARGMTIISKEFGVIKFYEETFSTVVKRDITIHQFPENLALHLPGKFPNLTFAEVNQLTEELYHHFYPACWSTNASFYTGSIDANCTIPKERVENFKDWSEITQSKVNDPKVWNKVFELLQSRLSHPY